MIEPLTTPSISVLLVIVLSFVGAILSEKLKVSYTTIMILLGLGVSILRIASGLSTLPLDRSLILGLVVPPLIFEAAMRTRYDVLKTVRKTIFFSGNLRRYSLRHLERCCSKHCSRSSTSSSAHFRSHHVPHRSCFSGECAEANQST